jgi:regulator of protease activity HflC (stomatin/prohibitin superfamily)
MPNSPARIRPEVVPHYTEQERQAVAARRQMEGGLLVHTLRAHFDREAARIDAEAVGEATQTTLGIELDVLTWGIEKANGSAAAAKLVADRVELLSRTNTKNLTRRFG